MSLSLPSPHVLLPIPACSYCRPSFNLHLHVPPCSLQSGTWAMRGDRKENMCSSLLICHHYNEGGRRSFDMCECVYLRCVILPLFLTYLPAGGSGPTCLLLTPSISAALPSPGGGTRGTEISPSQWDQRIIEWRNPWQGCLSPGPWKGPKAHCAGGHQRSHACQTQCCPQCIITVPTTYVIAVGL